MARNATCQGRDMQKLLSLSIKQHFCNAMKAVAIILLSMYGGHPCV